MAYQMQPQGMGPSMGTRSQQLPGGYTGFQTPTITPQQQQVMQMLLSQGMGGMQNLPSADFGPIKQQAQTQFDQDIIPGLSEQFSGMGSGNQSSSAFQQALGGAGAGLSERLSGMEQQFNMQNRQSEIGRLMQMLQLGSGSQFETGYAPRVPGFLENMLGNMLSGGGQAAGKFAGMAAGFGG